MLQYHPMDFYYLQEIFCLRAYKSQLSLSSHALTILVYILRRVGKPLRLQQLIVAEM
jgi:DNA-binding winged helix-turn-helix (wHTH) protein